MDGACILEKPRHVLLFTGKGATVEILNKTFDIAPEDARRACQALFRAFPHVRRIHFEVMFAPSTLALPARVLHHTDHMVIELPETEEEYARIARQEQAPAQLSESTEAGLQ